MNGEKEKEISHVWVSCLLILITFAVFGRALGFSFVPYDDPAMVTENGYVNQGLTWSGIWWAFTYIDTPNVVVRDGVENLWHPLTWISHMLDVTLFGGKNAAGHHFTSILLHACSGVCVFLLFKQVLKSSWKGFFCALLWLIHPLKVESVTWVSERKDILSGVFFWASLACVVKSFTKQGHWRKFAWLFFVCALLSKPSVVILPALAILLEGYFKKETKWNFDFFWKALTRWWSWFLTGGIVAIIAIVMQTGGSHQFFLEQSSLINRLTSASAGFWFYIWRILIPWDLTFAYPHPKFGNWVHLVATIALIYVAQVIWRNRQKQSLVFIGFGWLVACWLPVSGLFYVGSSFTADRYMYLALAGPILIFASRLTDRKAGTPILVTTAIIWGALSWMQSGTWKSGETLFTHATQAQPRLAVGWGNLGGFYKENKDLEKAEHCYDQALSIDPHDYIAWHNLAHIHQLQGHIDKAETAYQKSLAVYPDYLPSLKSLGFLLRESGRMEEAKRLFQRGSEKSTMMLWLWCETELVLENYSEARTLLNRIKSMPIRDPLILSSMARAEQFLSQAEQK